MLRQTFLSVKTNTATAKTTTADGLAVVRRAAGLWWASCRFTQIKKYDERRGGHPWSAASLARPSGRGLRPVRYLR
jgi:hypothetical protein